MHTDSCTHTLSQGRELFHQPPSCHQFPFEWQTRKGCEASIEVVMPYPGITPASFQGRFPPLLYMWVPLVLGLGVYLTHLHVSQLHWNKGEGLGKLLIQYNNFTLLPNFFLQKSVQCIQQNWYLPWIRPLGSRNGDLTRQGTWLLPLSVTWTSGRIIVL